MYVNAIHRGTRHDRRGQKPPHRSHGFGVEKGLIHGPIHLKEKQFFMRRFIRCLGEGDFDEMVRLFRQHPQTARFLHNQIEDTFYRFYSRRRTTDNELGIALGHWQLPHPKNSTCFSTARGIAVVRAIDLTTIIDYQYFASGKVPSIFYEVRITNP